MPIIRIIDLERTAGTSKGYYERAAIYDVAPCKDLSKEALKFANRKVKYGEVLKVIPQTETFVTVVVATFAEEAPELLNLWNAAHPSI